VCVHCGGGCRVCVCVYAPWQGLSCVCSVLGVVMCVHHGGGCPVWVYTVAGVVCVHHSRGCVCVHRGRSCACGGGCVCAP
jgi:hypothetical protein